MMDKDNAEAFHKLIKIDAFDVLGLIRCSRSGVHQRLLKSFSNKKHYEKVIFKMEYERRQRIFQHSSFKALLCRNLAKKVSVNMPDVIVASSLASVNFAKYVADHLAVMDQNIAGSVSVHAYDLNGGFISLSRRGRSLSGSRVVIISNFINDQALEKEAQVWLDYLGCKTVGIGSLFEYRRDRLIEVCASSDFNGYHAVDIKAHINKITDCEECVEILKL